MSVQILTGDCRAVLAGLPAGSVQCVVTSPPYYGLRDYGHDGQIGLEPSPAEYVDELVAVFAEVWRVLRDDGTVWLNLGDSYAGNPNSGGANANDGGPAVRVAGIPSKPGKPKDLLMIPTRVALALQSAGWFLRSDIIWHKPNPMPESVTDRPTSAHEHVFLLTKRGAYFYDAGAIREEGAGRLDVGRMDYEGREGPSGWTHKPKVEADGRNARNVWTIATQPYSGAHFATMPPELVERCIKAGTKPGDIVLDPFGGAGTTGLVADRLNRNAILIELNPAYAALARARICDDAPLFAEVDAA